MRKTARPVVWEGGRAPSLPLDPIGRLRRLDILIKCCAACGNRPKGFEVFEIVLDRTDDEPSAVRWSPSEALDQLSPENRRKIDHYVPAENQVEIADLVP